jgi:hypothetical protein
MAKKNYDDMTVVELRDAAAKHDIEGRSSMTKEELIEALHAADASAPPTDEAEAAPARERDTREIIDGQGVQLMVGGTLKTFSGSDPKTIDELERHLTEEQMLRLKGRGVLRGKWEPKGTPAAPMAGSRFARAADSASGIASAVAQGIRDADKPAKPAK